MCMCAIATLDEIASASAYNLLVNRQGNFPFVPEAMLHCELCDWLRVTTPVR